MIINELIKLMEDINIKEIPKNEDPKKVVNILEKSLILMKNKKVKELKYQLLDKCFKDYQ